MPVTRTVTRLIITLPALTALVCACGPGRPGLPAVGRPASSAPASHRGDPAASRAGAKASATPAAAGVLHGKVVVVDPGHNGGNGAAASAISRTIWNGRENEACDTVGAQTDSGYTEARFNWNVAQHLAADLRAEGAKVVLTRTSNTGVGPCVTRRTAIGNDAHADAAISVHADAGPPGGRGFAILEPVADGPNNAIIRPSDALGTDVRDAFAKQTGEPVSSYDGTNGIQPRDDLAGTNLSTVPKVFIECGNMRNAADAALVTTDSWQVKAARAIAAGLTAYLTAGR